MKRVLVLYLVVLIGCVTNEPGVPEDADDGDGRNVVVTGGGNYGVIVDNRAGDGHAGDDCVPTHAARVGTLIGTSEAGHVDGARSQVRLSNPVNVEVGPDGKVYVADFDNGKIRVVDPA